MKKSAVVLWVMVSAAASYGVLNAEGVMLDDDKMGLSKTSVFDDPAPATFEYPGTAPAKAEALPRAYDGAPPQVPHRIDKYLPITAEDNQCLDCHDEPARIGKPAVKGKPTPMPVSHYVKADDGSLKRSGARHACVQCHVPQAGVGELVGNSFNPVP
jgi:cytochrome c-type protein NapB